MSKFRAILFALVAMVAFGVVAVVSASATEWLVAGLPITVGEGELAVDSTGEVLFEDMEVNGTSRVAILCSILLEGTVAANGVDLITGIEGLAGSTELVTLTVTNPIKCSYDREGGNEVRGPCLPEVEFAPLFVPEKLDWVTAVLGTGPFTDLFSAEAGNGEPAYLVECLIIGNVAEDDLCEGVAETALSNTVSDVEALFNNALTTACTLGKATSGLIESEGAQLITLISTEMLQVS